MKGHRIKGTPNHKITKGINVGLKVPKRCTSCGKEFYNRQDVFAWGSGVSEFPCRKCWIKYLCED